MTLERPPPLTGKRKRSGADASGASGTTIHVTIGSYERALHGFAASLADTPTSKEDDGVRFSDLFLLNAHASSIRCLALSPASGTKRILATGSSDERINLYQISTIAPPAPTNKKVSAKGSRVSAPLLSTPATLANPQRNRELGSLMHHASTVTALSFPSHSKLLTGALDNTLSVLRTRDWTHLATMRAPAPKPRGRPEGDTAGPGETPAGIADVAVHPSQRLAISVGLGERCMRLWNLVGGTKAGVLVFDKRMLDMVGEPRKSVRAGEGKRIVWRADGQEFAVAFDKGVAVFSLDCTPTAVVALGLRERVSQIQYVPRPSGDDEDDGDSATSTIAVSTEAGDLLFYTDAGAATDPHPAPNGTSTTTITSYESGIRKLRQVARISNPTSSGPRSRIKDFQILPDSNAHGAFFVVAGSSDGAVRIWRLDGAALQAGKGDAPRVVGELLGAYETGKRITCLVAFVMDAAQSDGEDAPAAEVGSVPGFSSDSDSGDGSSGEEDESVEGDVEGEAEREEEEEEANGDDFSGFDSDA